MIYVIYKHDLSRIDDSVVLLFASTDITKIKAKLEELNSFQQRSLDVQKSLGEHYLTLPVSIYPKFGEPDETLRNEMFDKAQKNNDANRLLREIKQKELLEQHGLSEEEYHTYNDKDINFTYEEVKEL